MLSENTNYTKTKAICPKCKSKNLTIIEVSDAFQSWDQVNGIIDRNDGIMNHGDITRVEGICDECNYRWKFRCSQIDDLVINNKGGI